MYLGRSICKPVHNSTIIRRNIKYEYEYEYDDFFYSI